MPYFAFFFFFQEPAEKGLTVSAGSSKTWFGASASEDLACADQIMLNVDVLPPWIRDIYTGLPGGTIPPPDIPSGKTYRGH